MLEFNFKASFHRYLLLAAALFLLIDSVSLAKEPDKGNGPPPTPVRVAVVEIKTVSNQVSLVGTTEAFEESTVASEVSGVVKYFPAKEGDFVKKGDVLVNLKETEVRLRLKSAIAAREKILANLQNAEKELKRVSRLKETNSIAEKQYDTAFLYLQCPFPGINAAQDRNRTPRIRDKSTKKF